MTPPPELFHSKLVSRINRLLSAYLTKTNDNGMLYFPRAGIWRTPHTWLEPDLFYISAETSEQIDSRYPTTADLVIEVISTGSAIYDRNTKADTYAVLGVKELWLVDESFKQIEVRVLENGRYSRNVALESQEWVKSVVLPGLEFQVKSVFGG